MSLYKAPLDEMVASINALNPKILTPIVASDYVFSDPVAITPVGDFNAQITLTAKNESTPYAGSVTLRYHRMDLSELSTQVTLSVSVLNPTKTDDIFAAVNKRFGTLFTAADIVSRDLTADEKVEGAAVTLVAVATGKAWVGQVDVLVKAGGHKLSDYLKVTRLNGLNYPSPTTTRPYAQIYSFWRDASAFYTQLQALSAGTASLEALKTLLVSLTGDAWVTSGQARYSLQGAEITTVQGVTADAPTESNVKYDHYIKVMLSDQYCLGLTGELTLHYNEPAPE